MTELEEFKQAIVSFRVTVVACAVIIVSMFLIFIMLIFFALPQVLRSVVKSSLEDVIQTYNYQINQK